MAIEASGTRTSASPEAVQAEVVVFLHGAFCSRQDWRFQRAALEDRLKVLTPDLRGHGDNLDDATVLSVELWAQDVARLIEACAAGPAVVVGHSLGARVAIALAAARPDLVKGIVLIEGSRSGAASQGSAANAGSLVNPAQVMAQRFEGMFFANADPVEKARIIADAAATPAARMAQVAQAIAQWDRHGLEPMLTRLPPGLPALAIQSTFQDHGAPRASFSSPAQRSDWLDLLQARHSKVEMLILPGLGHFNMLEAPEPVSQAIEAFVRRAARSS